MLLNVLIWIFLAVASLGMLLYICSGLGEPGTVTRRQSSLALLGLTLVIVGGLAMLICASYLPKPPARHALGASFFAY